MNPLLPLVLSVLPVASITTSIVEIGNRAWRHDESGIVFPSRIGDLKRNEQAITENPRDVYVGYETKDKKLSVWFRAGAPMYKPCAEDGFDDSPSEEQYPNRPKKPKPITIESGPGSLPRDGAGGTTERKRYYWPQDGNPPSAVSEWYSYCSPKRDWFISYSATWTGPADEFPDLTPILQSVRWSDRVIGID